MRALRFDDLACLIRVLEDARRDVLHAPDLDRGELAQKIDDALDAQLRLVRSENTVWIGDADATLTLLMAYRKLSELLEALNHP